MIICEIPKSDILYLNTLNAVESLSVYEAIECADESNISVTVESIDGDYTRDSLGFDGNGVKVGQIEGGLPETGIVELNGTNITRHGDRNDSHATTVASIIAGKSGMAPSAELYCTTCISVPENIYQNVEWLISSGVNVINMSYGLTNASGEYDDLTKWIDHVIYQHANSISNVLVQKMSYFTNDSSIFFDFYPLTTGTKTIAIAWLKNTIVTNSNTLSPKFKDTALVDYDLYVRDYNEKLVGSSIYTYNSVEMVRFNATTTNKYTIEIKRLGSGQSYERISLAHVRD